VFTKLTPIIEPQNYSSGGRISDEDIENVLEQLQNTGEYIPPVQLAKLEILIRETRTPFIPPYEYYHLLGTNKVSGWWEGIKIREYLKRIKNRFGYPVRYYHSMDTFSGVMIWIHQEYRIHQTATKYWLGLNDNYRHAWRYVIVQRAELPFEQELIADMFDGIPYISMIADEVQNDLMRYDMYASPLYPNLSFYNTINDMMIYCNWDFVRQDLINGGF